MIDHRRTHPNNPAARPVTQGVLPAGEVLMTVAEVAATLRVSKMTVYRMIHSRQIEVLRIGRSMRLTRSEVKRYLRAGAEPAGQQPR
jgi:excisionase family DNA binding protein